MIIIDDDAFVSDALDTLLRSVGFDTRCYASAREFLESALPDAVCCLITDVRMPQIGGFELQAALALRGFEVPMIFMTGHGDIPMSVRAMKAGAIDFLVKPFRDQDMLDAVNAAIARSRASRAAASDLAALRARHAMLTPREREVMAGVVRGLLNKQVAGELGIAEITVKLHRSSLMKKLGVTRVTDLVRLADAVSRSFELPEGGGQPV